MTDLPHSATGSDCAAALRKAAAAQRVTMKALILSGGFGANFVKKVEYVGNPRPATIDRINALCRGEPAPVVLKSLEIFLHPDVLAALSAEARWGGRSVRALAAMLIKDFLAELA